MNDGATAASEDVSKWHVLSLLFIFVSPSCIYGVPEEFSADGGFSSRSVILAAIFPPHIL